MLVHFNFSCRVTKRLLILLDSVLLNAGLRAVENKADMDLIQNLVQAVFAGIAAACSGGLQPDCLGFLGLKRVESLLEVGDSLVGSVDAPFDMPARLLFVQEIELLIESVNSSENVLYLYVVSV